MSRREVEECDWCGMDVPDRAVRLSLDINVYVYRSASTLASPTGASESEDRRVCGAECATRWFASCLQTAMAPSVEIA